MQNFLYNVGKDLKDKAPQVIGYKLSNLKHSKG